MGGYEESSKSDGKDHKELLERGNMKPLSEKVKSCRCKMIGQDQNNCSIALSWAPEGERRRGRPKTTWRNTD